MVSKRNADVSSRVKTMFLSVLKSIYFQQNQNQSIGDIVSKARIKIL